VAWLATLALSVALLVACGDGTTAGDGAAGNGGNGADTAAPVATLPAECALPPYTVTAERDGATPIGAAEFGVVSAVAVQIPLVPNASEQLTAEEVLAQQATTDLVGYAIVFGDEQIDPAGVSLFMGWEPEGTGKVRGNVGVYPNSAAPLAVGDVITPGPLDGLDMFTTLNRIGLDLKVEGGELNAYLGDPVGSVTIVGLTDEAICLDVDLKWEYSDFGAESVGTLTIKGTFAALIATRTMSLT
jgi:hypothetical protein